MNTRRKLIGAQEAAEILRLNRMTLYRMLARGEIPGAFKIGRVWRVDLDDLDRFLADCRTRK